QERGPLHVEPRQPVEPGQGQPGTEERKPQRAGAKQLPEGPAEPVADGAGKRKRQERQADEAAGDERADGTEAAARAHAGAGWAAVSRRSWKSGRTGKASTRAASARSALKPRSISARPAALSSNGAIQSSPYARARAMLARTESPVSTEAPSAPSAAMMRRPAVQASS